MIEKILINSIDSLKNIAFDLNKYLFEHPEISGKEFNSSKKIVTLLRDNGINVEENFCNMPTAFFGSVVKKENSNINIGILTEYDALPGVGHACGHSASCAISVLSALCIKANEDKIDANIDIIGTPDEEVGGGKIYMAEKGVFDKYDYVIMVHLFNKNYPNWKMLAMETYDVKFKGTPAHAAASPWEGRSALDGLMLFIHAMDMMRKSVKPDTIVEGYITNGGEAINIIPEEACGTYGFRSTSIKYIKDTLVPWMRDILNGCAMATQTKAEMTLSGKVYMDIKYNKTGTQVISNVMKKYGMENSEIEKAAASSDIGNVSYRCPAFHPSVAITYDNVSLHSKEFAELVGSKAAENAIINGAKTILGFIGTTLDDTSIIEDIKREFESN